MRRVPSKSLVRLGQLHFPGSVQLCFFAQVSTFNAMLRMRAFVLDTSARNSRSRFRVSSTGEEMSTYSADDPRGARAILMLVVVGPGLDGNSSANPSTTGATSLASALRAHSIVVEALESTREFFTTSNVTLRSPFDSLQLIGPAQTCM